MMFHTTYMSVAYTAISHFIHHTSLHIQICDQASENGPSGNKLYIIIKYNILTSILEHLFSVNFLITLKIV